jgi:hypothetical protein
MSEFMLAFRWAWSAWLARASAPSAGAARAELRSLLERAAYDLRQGWPEAAYDCIGRALRLLEVKP